MNINNIKEINSIDNIIFKINDIEKLTILSNGNVGIGTTTPSYKLDVTGDINFTGFCGISGGLNINSGNLNIIEGNINNITSTELNYLSGTNKNINQNFVDTSNYIKNNEDIINNVANNINITNNNIIFNSNIIPSKDNIYDLGTPEFRFRDLYLGTNSLWLGDSTSLSASGGEMKIKKRNINNIPSIILSFEPINNIDAHLEGVKNANPNSGITSIPDVKIEHWLVYLKQLSGNNNLTANDLLGDNDYENVAAPNSWLENNNSNIILNSIYSNIGINNLNPKVVLDINATNAIRIPSGSILERPNTTGVDNIGYIRYNVEEKTFEGFGYRGNDIKWNHIGGVIDRDADTYITAENCGHEHDVYEDTDTISFYTDGIKRMSINDTGKIGIGKNAANNELEVEGNVDISGNLTVNNLTVNGTQTTINTEIQSTNILNIENNGTGTATTIKQTGANNILEVKHNTFDVLYINDSCNIGIANNNPDYRVDINGTLNIRNGSIKIECENISTNHIVEGSNLYYTNSRFNSDFDNKLSETTTTDIAEGNNLYYTEQRVNNNLANKTTDNIAEGNNLYYTPNRVLNELNNSNLYFKNNFVGINNTNPTESLHVNGNIKGNNFLGNGSNILNLNANNITSGKISNLILPNDINIDNNLVVVNKIGIGREPITEKLEVEGNAYINNNLTVGGNFNVVGSFITTNTDVTNTEVLNITNNGTDTAVSISQLGNNNIINIKKENSSVLFINEAGNIGINTILPSENLDVNGNIKAINIKGSGQEITNINADNITNGIINNSNLPQNITISDTLTAANLNISGTTANINTLSFQTNNLNIINNTNNPSFKITHNSELYNIIEIDKADLEILTITNSGKIGIGTTNPLTILNILKAQDPRIRITGTNTNDTAGLQLLEYNNDLQYGSELVYDGNNNYFQIKMYDNYVLNNALTIKRNDGNIGINNSMPNYKLDVNGDINITEGNKFKIGGTNLNQTHIEGILTLEKGGTGATTVEQARSNLGANNADNISIGTINNARLPANISVTSLTGSGANITAINATNITSGTINNARLPSDISITGTLTTANLNVSGTTTTINTATYETENLKIVSTNADGPSLKITHDTNLHNALEIDKMGTELFSISHDGKVGIGLTPNYPLDVNGDINITSGNKFKINGANLNQTDIEGTLSVANGGTGATTALQARTNLGVDPAGTDNSTNVTLANTNYLSISGQEITGNTIPISSGGTGATTQAAARTALNVDPAGTDNSTNVTLANTNYLTISGQEITGNTIPISSGGTGATTQAAARTALNVDVAGTDNSTNVTLTSVANNYLTISGQAITAGIIPISLGGTGATTQEQAITNLGVINNVKANWTETTTTAESYILNKPFTSLDTNTLQVTDGVLTVIGGGDGGGTTYIQEPTYTSSANVSTTQIDSEYKYITFLNQDLIWDFYPYNDATSWINYATNIGAAYSLANLQDWNGTFGVFTSGSAVGWIQFPPVPQEYNTAEIYFGNTHTDVVKLVINGTVIHTLTGVSSYVWNGSVNAGDIIRIEEVYSVIDGDIKIILSNNQTSYSITFPENTECDILVVGGGGGGGGAQQNSRGAGGGGAGEYLYQSGLIFNGTYEILLGKGGLGGTGTETNTSAVDENNGENGFTSSITQSTTIYDAFGGGGGAGGVSGGITTANGGACGGGRVTQGGGGTGSIGYDGGSGSDTSSWVGGGGGGMGSVGVDGSGSGGGAGGNGVVIDIDIGTGNVCGGGGGGGYTDIGLGGGNGVDGGGDGGGYGGFTNGTAYNGVDADNYGGGGGGATIGNSSSGNKSGGKGGSGIVIIRYKYASLGTSSQWTIKENDIYYDTGNVGIGTTTPDSKLHIYDGEDILKVSSSQITTFKSIIPSVDNTIDLGSVDNKFRDIFVSNNSLWVGDEHKISFSSGKLKIRKRKTDVIPTSIVTAGGDLSAALSFAGINSVTDMKLNHWLNYMRTLPNKTNSTIGDIFRDNIDDYEEETETDAWYSTSDNKLYLGTSYNLLGIGTTNPFYKLDVNGDINIASGSKFKINGTNLNQTHIEGTLSIASGGTGATTASQARSNLGINNATNITSGTLNNARLPSDISITGTLTTANLNVSGTTTTINTATYETENLKIVSTNADGPSLKITHDTNLYNALEIDKSGTNLFSISHDGKVGIGLTPNYPLDVNGLTKTSAIILENKEADSFTITDGLLIYDRNVYNDHEYGTDEWQGLNAFSQDGGVSGNGGALSIYNSEDGWCHLYDTFNTRFANGVWNNLKIRDDVDKSLTISINKNTIQQTGTNTNAGIFIKSKGTGSIIIGNETNNTLNVNGEQNRVGIGTTIPSSILDIRPSIAGSFFKTNLYAHILLNNGNSVNAWNIANRDSGILSIGNGIPTNDFLDTSTDVLQILENGNVGIGITPTTYKLDVNGDINIASGSKYKINGNDLSYDDLANTPTPYTLPIASATTLGGVKIDTNTLEITDGVLTVIGGGGGGGGGGTTNIQEPTITNYGNVNNALVLHYKLDTDLSDSTGNYTDLIATNTNFNNGVINEAIEFNDGDGNADGVGDWLQFPSNFNPYTIWNGNGITISFWLKLTETTLSFNRIFDFGKAGGEPAGYSTGLFLASHKDNSNGYYKTLVFGTNTPWGLYQSDTSKLDEIWTGEKYHHIVWCIGTDGLWTIYIDNVDKTSYVSGRPTTANSWGVQNVTYNSSYINRSTFYPYDDHFKGFVDDFRIYNKFLSETEVNTLYNTAFITTTQIDNEYKYIKFLNDGNNQSSYSITFPENTTCDILVVGGGGGGGGDIGGGGGAGGVSYLTNGVIPAGTFTVKVGNGGAGSTENGVNGNNSEFKDVNGNGITTYGGGGGAAGFNGTGSNGANGGSGGGGGANGSSNPSGGSAISGTFNGTYAYTSITHYGNAGGGDDTSNWEAGGGGGAGGAGSTASSGTGTGGNGISINITGTDYYWGGGGGAGIHGEYGPANGGLGGGGAGGLSAVGGPYPSGGTGGITDGQATSSTTGGNGGAGTGGGGGGGAWSGLTGGNGGSGIVIIRYKYSSISTYNDLNVTGTYNLNGIDVRNYTAFYDNQIVQTIFAPYKKMAVKTAGETNWVFPDNNETSGFIVKITPKSSQSGILLDLKMHFGFHYNADARWWGARLYRKIGTGSWTWISDAGGDFSSNDGATGNGTSCWFGDTSGVNGDPTMGTCSASYMDLPNTTSEVIYTIAVRCRLGSGDIGDETWYINRAYDQGDSFRPAPMSSWTAREIWKGTTTIIDVSSGLPSTVSVDNSDLKSITSLDTNTLEVTNGVLSVIGGGGSSQWTTTGNNIYYTTGSVGIGTNNPRHKLDIYGGNLGVRSTSENTDSAIYIGAPHDPNAAYKGAIIFDANGSGQGWSTGVLHICNRDAYSDNSTNVSINDARISIKPNGNVGIGTTSPNHPLHITSGNGYYTGPLYSYHHSVGSWGGFGGNNWTAGNDGSISLRCNEGLIASRMYVMSDLRIKTDISDIIDDEALIKFRKLQPKKYKYIDKLKYKDNEVYGFIAQDVSEILSNAVTYEKDYIPDIMLTAEVLILDKKSKLTTNENHNLNQNDIIRCKTSKYQDLDNIKVLEVIDEKTIIIDYIFNEEEIKFQDADNVIIIYGRLIEDFNVLNKETIWTLTTSALQEVDRQLQQEKNKIIIQQKQINELETKYNNLQEILSRNNIT